MSSETKTTQRADGCLETQRATGGHLRVISRSRAGPFSGYASLTWLAGVTVSLLQRLKQTSSSAAVSLPRWILVQFYQLGSL